MKTVFGVSKVFQRYHQQLLRQNMKSFSTRFATREFEEIKFNVPWGHVSGKWYGPKDKRPIVGFHGLQDNAGSFDTIAPLLPSHVGFLALDLPGHGLSSWLPDGCMYHVIDYMKFMLLVMHEFKWDKISMMCHSMSSINGFLFCSLYPDKCDMYIGLDVLKPVERPTKVVIDMLAHRLGKFHTYNEQNRSKVEPPCYEFDELVEKLHEGSEKSIDKDCCQFILNRNIKPSSSEPNKYYFSLDSRLKPALFYDLPSPLIDDLARRITSPFLFIKALQGPYYEDKRNYNRIVSLMKEKPTFEHHEVEGKHHVHLNEPQKVADIVNPFINKCRPE